MVYIGIHFFVNSIFLHAEFVFEGAMCKVLADSELKTFKAN